MRTEHTKSKKTATLRDIMHTDVTNAAETVHGGVHTHDCNNYFHNLRTTSSCFLPYGWHVLSIQCGGTFKTSQRRTAKRYMNAYCESDQHVQRLHVRRHQPELKAAVRL